MFTGLYGFKLIAIRRIAVRTNCCQRTVASLSGVLDEKRGIKCSNIITVKRDIVINNIVGKLRICRLLPHRIKNEKIRPN